MGTTNNNLMVSSYWQNPRKVTIFIYFKVYEIAQPPFSFSYTTYMRLDNLCLKKKFKQLFSQVELCCSLLAIKIFTSRENQTRWEKKATVQSDFMPNMKYKSYSYREIAEAGKSITNTRMLYMFCSFFVIFQSKRFYSTSVLFWSFYVRQVTIKSSNMNTLANRVVALTRVQSRILWQFPADILLLCAHKDTAKHSFF